MKKSTILMYVVWLAMLAIYFIDPFFRGYKFENVYFVSTSLVLTFLIFYWFVTDASEMQITPSAGLKIGVIAVAFMALPYYLIRYKGFKRSLLSFVKFFGFVALFLATTYLLDLSGLPA